jgi:hypothetical protein
MLKVAACTNPDCTTKVITVVDQSPNSPCCITIGRHASVTIGLDGLALISYTELQSGSHSHLRVAHCLNVMCTASTRITADNVSSARYTSIAIGADGLGVVSYHDAAEGDLKIAHCANLDCSSVTRVTVDSFDYVGMFVSTTIGADGLPLVSYAGPGIVGTNALRVVHCGNPDCTAPIKTPFLVPEGVTTKLKSIERQPRVNTHTVGERTPHAE